MSKKIKQQIEFAAENKKPVPPEVIEAGAVVLLEVIKQLFAGRKTLRKRVEVLEAVVSLQAEQIAKISKQVENL